MTNPERQHPEIDDLLRIVVGDPADAAGRRVQKHVQACWKCRAHVDEARSTLDELARYHERVLLPNLPEPPRPWVELRALRSQRKGRGSGAPAIVYRPVRGRIGRLVLASVSLACLAFALASIVRNGKPQGTPTRTPAAVPQTVTQPPRRSESVERAKPPIRVLPERPLTAAPLFPTSSTQVRVFGALHEIGADLGDPVEVAVLGHAVRVRGQGLDEARASEIREVLSRIPGVAIEFAGDPQVPANHSGDRLSLNAGHGPFEQQLRQALGSSGQLEQFASVLLDESDAVLARAHALRNLDEHFPEASRTMLDPHDRSVLDGIVGNHKQAAAEHVHRMSQMLERVRGTLHPPAARPAAADLLAASQRVDRVLGVMFGVAASDTPASAILQEFAQAWTDLAAVVGQDKRLVGKGQGESR